MSNLRILKKILLILKLNPQNHFLNKNLNVAIQY